MENNRSNRKLPIVSSYIALFLNNVKAFEQNSVHGNKTLMYRGQSNISFPIRPSVFRKNNLAKEAQMVNELKRIAPHEFAMCSSRLECLIKMQHYGLPTRLLDITFNPLVALYFACFDKDNKKQPGVVYSFSDYVYSCDETIIQRNILLSTYSGCSPVELSNHIRDHFNLLDFKGLSNKEEVKRFFGEKYHAIVPPLNNERIRRQQGGFLLFGLDVENQMNPFQKEAFDIQLNSEQEDVIAKTIVVLPNDKEQILNELDVIGINHAFLFPELEHQADYVKHKYCGS